MGTRPSSASTEPGPEGKLVKVVCGSTGWEKGRGCHKEMFPLVCCNDLEERGYLPRVGREWDTASDSSTDPTASHTRPERDTSSLHKRPHRARHRQHEGSVHEGPRFQTSQCKRVHPCQSPAVGPASGEVMEPGHFLKMVGWANLSNRDCECMIRRMMCSVVCWDSVWVLVGGLFGNPHCSLVFLRHK